MIYSFEDFELDPERFELRLVGTPQKIEPQVFELLSYLVQRAGQFVAKDSLHDAIWQGRVVADSTIAGAIKAARRAVGDDGKAQRLIRTVHGRGFCFAGTVVATDGAATVENTVPVAAQMPASPDRAPATAARSAAVLSADVHLCELINGDAPAAAAESQLLSHRTSLRDVLESSGGRILGATGGGIAARFDHAEDAVQCAATLQRWGPRVERAAAPEQSARVRVGVCGLGTDVDRDAGTAARLQCLASPGQICVTGSIEQAVRDRHGFVGSPIAGDLDPDLNDLRLSIIHSRQLPAGADPGGVAQLQCGAPFQPREPSVAILPFQAVGSDDLAAEIAEGLRIDVQNGLVKISRLLLIAAGSANAFRGKSPEVAARSLGVRYVLQGAVQIVKTRVRISLELVDTLSTQAVWSEQYKLALDDAFAIQDDITGKVIAALDAKLYSGEQARIWQQVLIDPKVVRVFYRGVRLFFRMDREAMAEAIRSFESVAEMRPSSSIGATWVAMCHWIEHQRGWRDPPSQSRRLAKQWAEVAAKLPDADGQAHTVLAHAHLLDREFDAALLAGRQALEIRPGCANANGFFGHVLHYCGEQDEAISRIKRGIRLQPVYPPFFACMLAAAYLASGQTETAILVAKEALRLNARDIATRLILVAAARAAGADRLSDIFAAEVLHLEPAFSVSAWRAGQPYRDASVVDGMAGAWLAAGLGA